MSKSRESILSIVQAGANVIVDCQSKSRETLFLIAEAAAVRGVTATFINCDSFHRDTLVELAKRGKGSVTVEV